MAIAAVEVQVLSRAPKNAPLLLRCIFYVAYAYPLQKNLICGIFVYVFTLYVKYITDF